MAAAPDPTRREGDLDGDWDDGAGDAQPRSRRSPTPVRSGTHDWGDLDAAVDAHRARMRAATQPEAPTRGGTRDWEELLPPAVLARYRAAAAAARSKGSPVRGGTRDWDELTRLVNAEIAAARARTAPAEDPLDALAVDELAALLLGEAERGNADGALDDAPSIVVHGEEPWDGQDDH